MEEERAIAMARRLVRTARRAGLPEQAADCLVDVFGRVMDRREAALSDPAHPEYLHPARTALILLDDAQLTRLPALVASMAYDSVRPALNLPERELRAIAGEEAIEVVRQLPTAELDDSALLEALVVAEPALLNGALAERLDHARHLHLGPPSAWREFHRQVNAVYLPAARRAHPKIAQRFGRWAEAFEWRFLRRLV